jgi:hypothetical protein
MRLGKWESRSVVPLVGRDLGSGGVGLSDHSPLVTLAAHWALYRGLPPCTRVLVKRDATLVPTESAMGPLARESPSTGEVVQCALGSALGTQLKFISGPR